MTSLAGNTVLCVCTYKRPDGLERLLAELPQLMNADGLQVVVIDNDAAGDGLAVCNDLPADYPYVVHGVLEPNAGISHARNAAVREALLREPEFLVFLDDDEWPDPSWLSELMRVQQSTGADAVGGPTLSDFPPDADARWHDNPYYGADLGLADGARCTLQAAGNFLIRAATIRQLGPVVFRPEFAQSGGEDLAFFTELDARGATMAWASHAVVHESVPANRLSMQWVRQRVITIHNSRVRVMQLLQPGLSASAVRGAKTVALCAQATLTSALGLLSERWRNEAQLLRWKFIGKLSAHLRRTRLRGEGH